MGKYQLDYKGMQQVERYHEKNATVKNDKKAHVQALLKKIGGVRALWKIPLAALQQLVEALQGEGGLAGADI